MASMKENAQLFFRIHVSSVNSLQQRKSSPNIGLDMIALSNKTFVLEPMYNVCLTERIKLFLFKFYNALRHQCKLICLPGMSVLTNNIIIFN